MMRPAMLSLSRLALSKIISARVAGGKLVLGCRWNAPRSFGSAGLEGESGEVCNYGGYGKWGVQGLLGIVAMEICFEKIFFG